MVGGPSRHYAWDDASLLEQIDLILKKSEGIIWHITDSPRTPVSTSDALGNLKLPGVTFHSYKDTGPYWVTNQLLDSGYVWVSEDSMSMIYESMTAGAAIGILSVPAIKQNKISLSINRLADNEMITRFDDWRNGKQLSPCPEIFDEADRCARELLDKITQHYHVH